MSKLWFWLSIIEFLLIIFLVYKQLKKMGKSHSSDNLPYDQLKKARNTKIDMDNIISSINKSKDLYKELSTRCHPDRFVNSPKQKLAEEIFQEISKNKRNYEELNKLKKKAKIELGLIFD